MQMSFQCSFPRLLYFDSYNCPEGTGQWVDSLPISSSLLSLLSRTFCTSSVIKRPYVNYHLSFNLDTFFQLTARTFVNIPSLRP